MVSPDCLALGQFGYACPGAVSVNISGSSGTADFTVSYFQPQMLSVVTQNLPDALVTGGYSVQLQAAGGQPPYTWSLSLGSLPLPTGLALSPSGQLSGVPGLTGTYYFVVRVTDDAANADDQTLALTILPRPVISGAHRVSSSQFQFTASGSSSPLIYEFQYSTNLANWVTFFATNFFSAGSGPFSPFVVTDFAATNKARFYRILVSADDGNTPTE